MPPFFFFFLFYHFFNTLKAKIFPWSDRKRQVHGPKPGRHSEEAGQKGGYDWDSASVPGHC